MDVEIEKELEKINDLLENYFEESEKSIDKAIEIIEKNLEKEN